MSDQITPIPFEVGFKHYVSSRIGRENHDFFAKWAFGNDFEGNVQAHKIPELWNKNHGDDLKISGNDNVIETLNKMIMMYCQEHSPMEV